MTNLKTICEEVKKLDLNASPSPWFHKGLNMTSFHHLFLDGESPRMRYEDALFISHSRELLPKLAQAVLILSEALEKSKALRPYGTTRESLDVIWGATEALKKANDLFINE